MSTSLEEKDWYTVSKNSQDSPIPNEHSSQPLNTTDARKRKEIKDGSVVWDHFEKILDEEGCITSAKCNYCDRIFKCHPKNIDCSTLQCHMDACMKNPHNSQTPENSLNSQPSDEEDCTMSMSTYYKIRKALAYMIIVDELPYKFVEGEGFKEFMSKACPGFIIPSRLVVARDCYQLYVDERTKLKSFIKKNCQRVSLTTDTWTSLQGLNYMCITAHFIDNEWNLHKKILNFVLVSSHKGDYIGKALETCVLDWGLKNVFTVTLDNSSSNDTAIAFLKKRMSNWGNGVANCKYLHVRCIAHIINLVVLEGIKDVDPSVRRVRDAVRYIRNSPARLRKFKECVEYEGIESEQFLCLDVATRWNSTYLMLKRAEIFEKAFEKYELEDLNYVADLGMDGVPRSYDWACVRKLTDLLTHFYEMTLNISGSLSVTSDSFFSEISDLCCILDEWKASDDLMMKNLGESVRLKFDKYWGEPEKMNKLIFWANVFDPRDKYEFIQYSLIEMYGEEKGGTMLKGLRDELSELFKEYEQKYGPKNDANTSGSSIFSSSSSVNVSDSDSVGGRPYSFLKAKYKKQKMVSGGGGNKKTELEVYLNEDTLEDAENLNVLNWWKTNSDRFPVLSKMARDILAIPISTFASESAFSTDGRVLDAFKSSLTPKLVESMVCGRDWLLASKTPANVEEEFDELEIFEEELPKVGLFR